MSLFISAGTQLREYFRSLEVNQPLVREGHAEAGREGRDEGMLTHDYRRQLRLQITTRTTVIYSVGVGAATLPLSNLKQRQCSADEHVRGNFFANNRQDRSTTGLNALHQMLAILRN